MDILLNILLKPPQPLMGLFFSLHVTKHPPSMSVVTTQLCSQTYKIPFTGPPPKATTKVTLMSQQ